MVNQQDTPTSKQIAHKLKSLSEEEVFQFLQAFLTPKEFHTLCERYELVRLLVQGVPQREISEKLGVSISQISRGSAELKYGAGAEIFPKLFQEENNWR